MCGISEMYPAKIDKKNDVSNKGMWTFVILSESQHFYANKLFFHLSFANMGKKQ